MSKKSEEAVADRINSFWLEKIGDFLVDFEDLIPSEDALFDEEIGEYSDGFQSGLLAAVELFNEKFGVKEVFLK